MMITSRIWLALGVLGLAALAGPQARALEGLRPVDAWWPEDAKVAIEWKESWEATAKANEARWKKEVDGLEKDGTNRARRLALRMVRLYEALLAKYPDDPEKRAVAYREIAERYYAADLDGRGSYYLKRLVEEFPGQPEQAAEACHRILAEARPESPWDTIEGPEWVEYGFERLLALQHAGYLPDSHPYVIDALRAKASLCRFQGRFLEAAEAMARLEPLSGRDEWFQLAEADLYFLAGDDDHALALFRDIFARTEHWFARDRIGLLAGELTASPPTYPSKFGIEMRWESARAAPIFGMADTFDRLLQEDATGENLVPWGKSRQTSVWAALDRHLLAQDAQGLLPVREAEERAAADQVRAARRRGSRGLLALYRRYPWAAASHGALVEAGEDALRAGHAGLAARSFEDALRHASDPAIRARARTGLWLALATRPQRPADAAAAPAAGARRERLERAFEGVPDDAPVDWMGQRKPARFVRERLLASLAEAPAPELPDLKSLTRRVLQLPALSAWPDEIFGRAVSRGLSWAFAAPVDVQAHADGVLVSGPDCLANFGPDGGKPTWVRASRRLRGAQGRLARDLPPYITVPGVYRPVVADGRIYARWGLDSSRLMLAGLAALDARTGEMLWSTARDPAWQEMWPVSDPAVAEGRIYILTIRKGYEHILPLVPLSLVCLDAASGRLLWQQLLASQTLALQPSERSDWRTEEFDMVHYGNAVTVEEGTVFCSTNLGFVARCDARDGVVEWLWAYPRVRPRYNVPHLVRRLGAPPAVVGGRVVVLPRDREGAFALDRETGKLLWENPFLPSQQLIGRIDGLLLAADTSGVAALDAATGQAAWHRRFPEGVVGAPRLIGSSLVVATRDGLVRCAARTGDTLGSMPWGSGGAMEAFEVAGNQLVGVSGEPRGLARDGIGTALGPQAPTPAAPVGLPVKQAWSLPRANPTLLVPPPEAKVPGRLYLLSEGVLECVRADAQGSVEWRRLLRPSFPRLVWAENLVLAMTPESVTAIDASTGALRWEREIPFRIRQWKVASPWLFLGEWSDEDVSYRTCLVELATGKVVWSRDFRDLHRQSPDRLHRVAWDGESLHLVARMSHEGGGFYDVAVRPSDARITRISRFRDEKTDWALAYAEEDGRGFYLDPQRVGWAFVLDGKTPPVRFKASFRELSARPQQVWARISGPWIEVHEYASYPAKHVQWILKRDDPAYELVRPRPGVVRGDRLYEVHDNTLTAIDLPSRKEVARCVVDTPKSQPARILDFEETGNSLLVVSGVSVFYNSWQTRPYRVRLDVFDRATGQPRATQVLGDVPYWWFNWVFSYYDHVVHQTQAALVGGVLFLTDMHGLRAFAAAPGYEAPEGPVHIAYRASQPIVPDGSLAEWEARGGLPVRARDGSQGRLFLAHDEENLFLGLALPSRDPRPRCGAGESGGGDWLEVGLTTGEGSRRWGVGLDRRGRVLRDDLAEGDLPEALRGGIRYDPDARQLLYELAIPLDAVLRKSSSGHWRTIGLSLAAWEERPDEGAVCVLQWGGGVVGGPLLEDDNEAAFLHTLTREGEEAGLAIADELPELPESWRFFEQMADLRAPTPYSRNIVPIYADYLKRHREGLPAERALVSLDQKLRRSPQDDPSGEILKLAEAAGVAADVRQRYALLARPQLSQWVFLPPKEQSISFMIQLADERGQDGFDHRVTWGDGDWRSMGEADSPSRRDGGRLPEPGEWAELRIPLIWLDMQDTPIDGISYAYQGCRPIWDRTAVRIDGRERVFIDDKLPSNRTTGTWQWVSDPKHSGTKAQTDPSRDGRHEVWGFDEPIADHIPPPLEGLPTISQWVYLDPQNPPKTIAVSLYGDSEWRHRALWGVPGERGRYMGPLPKPGQWIELRIPLSSTWFYCRPIDGFSFEQQGGRVVWDRTAIVAGGRERVLIDDEMPEGPTGGANWEWVDQPVKSGKKAHTQQPRKEFAGHYIHHLKDQITDHVPLPRDRVIAVLKERIPRLGPTHAAWRFYGALLDFARPDTAGMVAWDTWFLKAFPAHPNMLTLLERLLARCKRLDPQTGADKVQALMEEAGVPRAVRFQYNRTYVSRDGSFLRNWLVIGPFPNKDGKERDRVYPPETEPVDLAKAIDGQGGQVRWKVLNSTENLVYLDGFLVKPEQPVVAYAVSWIQAEKATFAVLDVGSDDGCKLWLNRKLLLDISMERALEPRQNSVPIFLRAGWNEVLLKIDSMKGKCGFCVELVDREGRAMLKDVRIAATPPGR